MFDSLNGVPEALHGADVTRVRQWYLDGAARRYRQTVILSSFASPEMNALLARSCASHAGKAKLVPRHKVRGKPRLSVRRFGVRVSARLSFTSGFQVRIDSRGKVSNVRPKAVLASECSAASTGRPNVSQDTSASAI